MQKSREKYATKMQKKAPTGLEPATSQSKVESATTRQQRLGCPVSKRIYLTTASRQRLRFQCYVITIYLYILCTIFSRNNFIFRTEDVVIFPFHPAAFSIDSYCPRSADVLCQEAPPIYCSINID